MVCPRRNLAVWVTYYLDGILDGIDRQDSHPHIIILAASSESVDRCQDNIVLPEGSKIAFPPLLQLQSIGNIVACSSGSILFYRVNQSGFGKHKVALHCRLAVDDKLLSDDGTARRNTLKFSISTFIDTSSRTCKYSRNKTTKLCT